MRWTFTFVLALAAWPLAAQDKLALDGIAHVAFRVSDLSASRVFYGKLGFEQAFEFSDAAGTTVSYLKVNDRQFIELYRRGQTEKELASQPLGLMHICFDTHSELDNLNNTNNLKNSICRRRGRIRGGKVGHESPGNLANRRCDPS